MDTIDRLMKKYSAEQTLEARSKRVNIEETDPIEKQGADVDEIDLEVMKFRDILDPSKFYKRKATSTNPVAIAVGTTIDDPVDFYSGRVHRKERKTTLIDDLLSEYRSNVKKRFYNKSIKAKEKALVERRKALQKKAKAKKNKS